MDLTSLALYGGTFILTVMGGAVSVHPPTKTAHKSAWVAAFIFFGLVVTAAAYLSEQQQADQNAKWDEQLKNIAKAVGAEPEQETDILVKAILLRLDELGRKYEQIKDDMHKRPAEGSIDAYGKWTGNTFKYYQPNLVFTKRATFEDNRKPFVFKVGGIPKGAFLYWEIEADRAVERVFGLVDTKDAIHAKEHIRCSNPSKIRMAGGVELPDDELLSLTMCMMPETSPIIFRVYLTSFSVKNVRR